MAQTTKHSRTRLKERAGITKGIADMMTKRAYREGIKESEMTGELRALIDARTNSKASCIRFYGGKLYLFSNNGNLLTVYDAPQDVVSHLPRYVTAEAYSRYTAFFESKSKQGVEKHTEPKAPTARQTKRVHEHVFSTQKIFRAPDCANNGVMLSICACGETRKEVIPRMGHQFIITERTESTCGEAGKQISICTRCGQTQIKIFPKRVHEFDRTTPVVITPPTCTEKGVRGYRCKMCGLPSVSALIDALPHEYNDWETDAATGEVFRTCKNCGTRETRQREEHESSI